MLTRIIKNVTEHKVEIYRFRPLCQYCGKECHPDNFCKWISDDIYGQYCHCEVVNCTPQMTAIDADLERQEKRCDERVAELRMQIESVLAKKTRITQKRRNTMSISHLAKMIPAFRRVAELGQYKSTRKQATIALKQLRFCRNMLKRIRPNANYKAPPATSW